MFLFPLIVSAGSKDAWIEKLHVCENRDNVEKILDTNNKYSYAYLMFQLDTFYGFGKQYGFFPEGFTREEARLMIHIPSLQRAIAREMLDDGLSYHWKTCASIVVKKIGPYPQIDT